METQLPAEAKIDVVAVNRSTAQIMLQNGDVLPIVTWLDSDGDECSEPEAVVAVAGEQGRGFLVVELWRYTETVKH